MRELVEDLREISLILMNKYGVKDFTIISEELFTMASRYAEPLKANERHIYDRLSVVCPSGEVRIMSNYPSPSTQEIEKAVRSELNAREINRQKHGLRHRR